MFRKTIAAVLLGLTCTLTATADDDTKPGADDQKAKFDRAKVFDRMDVNADGKVTREEYKAAMEGIGQKLMDAGKGARLGDKLGQFGEKGFDKMDANGDGVITKEEFENAGGRLGNLSGKLDPEKLKKLRKKGE